MAGCPVCGGLLVTDMQRGEVVCAQCGLVVAESTVDVGPEWRVFNEREKRRVRAAPLKLVVKTDMAVRPEHGARCGGWQGYTETPYTATRGGWLKLGLS
jgi:uncharacterized Zn finger protein (UPF0148 family)